MSKESELSCTVWKSTIKRDHAQKFPWNHLFSNFFSKIVGLTEKMWIVFLTTFPHGTTSPFFRENDNKVQRTVWKSRQKYDHCFLRKIYIFSVKSTTLLKKLLKRWFHGNFWAWSRFIVLFHTVISEKLLLRNFFVEMWQ